MAQSLRIAAADGYALGATLHDAGVGTPLVIINGATAVRQRYYGRFAEWLTTQNLSALTYDYRGIGESRPHRLRGFDARMRDWGQLDFEGVLRFAAQRWPGRALHVVGHSVGGQILGFAQSNALISRAVTVSSQSGYWRHWPTALQPGMVAIWYGVFPLTSKLAGFYPGKLGLGEDLPEGVATEWASWARHPEAFLGSGIPREGFARLRAPVLSYSFTDDATYAPKPAVDWLHGLFTQADVTRKHVKPADLGLRRIGHFGFFREALRDTLWTELAAFLNAGEAPLRVGSKVEAGLSPPA